jgi:hypothetical protein
MSDKEVAIKSGGKQGSGSNEGIEVFWPDEASSSGTAEKDVSKLEVSVETRARYFHRDALSGSCRSQ